MSSMHIGGRSRLAVAVCLACLAPVACGGDADQPAAAADAPKATGPPPEEVATRAARFMSRAATKRDCRGLDRLNTQSTYKIDCPLPPEVRTSLGRFEHCQRPSVSPQRRPSGLPVGGHVFSPLVAIGSPRLSLALAAA